MSYTRFPVYIWADGYSIHFWVDGNNPDVVKAGCGHLEDPDAYDRTAGVHMPEKMFDELVLCRYAEMVQDGLVEKTLRRMKRRGRGGPWWGNFGSWSLRERFGEDPAAELKKRVERAKEKP